MSSLRIKEKFVEDFKNFEWDKYKAVVLSKEKRNDGDYYFGLIVRHYGEIPDGTKSYDVGDRSEDFMWLGRTEKWIGKRVPDIDPNSPTFGQRIYQEAIIEEIERPNSKGKMVKEKVVVEGRAIYEYPLKVNEKNTANIKKLVGLIDINKYTTFQIIYGTGNPISIDEETFFSKTSDEIYQSNILALQNQSVKDKK